MTLFLLRCWSACEWPHLSGSFSSAEGVICSGTLNLSYTLRYPQLCSGQPSPPLCFASHLPAAFGCLWNAVSGSSAVTMTVTTTPYLMSFSLCFLWSAKCLQTSPGETISSRPLFLFTCRSQYYCACLKCTKMVVFQSFVQIPMYLFIFQSKIKSGYSLMAGS